jgi:dihydroorotate dehydrogenase electron transfer subunit
VPGQFVTLYSRDSSRILPRPFGICDVSPEEDAIRIVYRVVGSGTREMAGYKAGDPAEIMGPLGNGFPMIRGRALLIGGGSGLPPILNLAKRAGTESGENIAVIGYRDSDMFLQEDFEKAVRTYVATDDGSFGVHGTVLDAIREDNFSADVICACGPTPMLRAVKAYAAKKKIPCYVSLEARMACGIGACLACVVRTTEIDAHSNVKNRRVCKDGPVFEAGEVDLG